MKLSRQLLTTLLPVVAVAMPSPALDAPTAVGGDGLAGLKETRATYYNCAIVGNANANCRACPETDSSICPVKTVLKLGSTYPFSCRIQGQAVQGD
jgi:hypothetical protein